MAKTKRIRVLQWALGAIVLMGLMCAGFFVFVVDTVHPEVAEVSAGKDRPDPVAAPKAWIQPSREALTGCGVTVEVVDEDGDAVPGAALRVDLVRARDGTQRRFADEADDDGLASWPGMDCGNVSIAAQGPGGDGATHSGSTDLDDGPVLWRLVLGPTLQVEGVVRDPDGDPIEGVAIDTDVASAKTDHRGRYRVPAKLGGLGAGVEATGTAAVWVHADTRGYKGKAADAMAASDRTEVEAGDVLELDFELWPAREILVHCLGLPDDRCDEILILCTQPYVPVGDRCRPVEGSPTADCACSVSGTVAIRGGGKSVLVPEDEDETELDFTEDGAIVGTITKDGTPTSECRVAAIRLPHGLEDLPKGGVNAHISSCDPDGRFALGGLAEGDWQLELQGEMAGEGSMTRTLTTHFVAPGQVVDVGEIDLRGGGIIEGRLVDGITGEPRANAPILALRQTGEDERSTPSMADTNQDGHFTMDGLPPGIWSVSWLPAPYTAVDVVVEDGVITDGVELETADAGIVEGNGFALAETGEGLVVDAVDGGSAAEAAGLMEGDVVVGLTVGGINLDELPGDAGPALSRLVLGYWNGPGVTMLVDQDGDLAEVPLEW